VPPGPCARRPTSGVIEPGRGRDHRPLRRQVLARDFVYGSKVEQGQELLRLDGAEIERERRKSQVATMAARQKLAELVDWEIGNDVQRARRQVAQARQNLERLQQQVQTAGDLLRRGIIARQEQDSLQQQLRQQELQVFSSEQDLAATLRKGSPDQVTAARLELASTEEKLQDQMRQLAAAHILAPVSGVALRPRAPSTAGGDGAGSRDVTVGGRVDQGRTLLEIGDLTTLAIRSQVDEVDVARVRPGLPVTVRGAGFGNQPLAGEVTAVSSQANADRAGGRAPRPRFDVVVTIRNLPEPVRQNLRIGMSATVEIVIYENPTAILVPQDLVQRGPAGLRLRVRKGGTGEPDVEVRPASACRRASRCWPACPREMRSCRDSNSRRLTLHSTRRRLTCGGHPPMVGGITRRTTRCRRCDGSSCRSVRWRWRPAMPAPRAVDFYFENNQTANDARGVTHGAHDWLYMGPRQERSATINYGRGKYYYDANMTENRDGGEVYCKRHIEIDQRDNRVLHDPAQGHLHHPPLQGRDRARRRPLLLHLGVADAPEPRPYALKSEGRPPILAAGTNCTRQDDEAHYLNIHRASASTAGSTSPGSSPTPAASRTSTLCLQEVADNFPELASSRGENQFAELAALLPGYTAVEGVAVDLPDAEGRRKRFGNMVLSRLPVGRVLRHAAPWVADGSRSMPRVVIEAVVHAAFGPVRVMTTHLEFYSADQRSAQVATIRQAHRVAAERALLPPKPGNGTFATDVQTPSAIVTGDFNMTPRRADTAGPARPVRRRPGLPGRLDGRPRTALHPHSFCIYEQLHKPPHTSDYVLVTEDLAPRVRNLFYDTGTQVSDHQPVLLELD
jgi:endonuclease/exonuclease/phosphatase family metal-dependent hydrolase/multidrug efflux pump subunit AcrA (membrane-fusion protein)